MATTTSKFGSGKRESHDAARFYGLSIYENDLRKLMEEILAAEPPQARVPPRLEEWAIGSTVPPQRQWMLFLMPVWAWPLLHPVQCGKEYDLDLSMGEYLALIRRVGQEVYRVLKPGGRYVVNIANLGRKPYIPLHAYFYLIHSLVGFQPAGDLAKGRGMNGSCGGGHGCLLRPRLRNIPRVPLSVR